MIKVTTSEPPSLRANDLNSYHIPPDSPIGWRVSSWITAVGSVGVITALGGVAMFAFLTKLVGQRYAFITALASFLGSLPFPYATMLFSHAAVIGLICIALWAIADSFFWSRMRRDQLPSYPLASRGDEGCGEGTTTWLPRYLHAGFCSGLAISSEYTAATAAGGILALALMISFKRGLVLALAAVPPLLLVPAYNWACFGGPLAFGYHHLALTQFQEMNKGLFGITFPPKLSAAYLVLISPDRGLFCWSPFFLMALLGLSPAWKSSRSLFLVSYYVILLHVLFISGYYMPGGGAAFGPRHLAPMLPFAVIFAALALRQWPRLGLTLGCLSILVTGIGTIVTAMPPQNTPNLLLGFYGERLLQGQLADNLGLLLGIPPALSVVPIVAAIVVLLVRLLGNREERPETGRGD